LIELASDLWSKAEAVLERTDRGVRRGKVTDITGLVIEGDGPAVGIGTTCLISQTENGARSATDSIPAQVVGFRKDKILLMPLGEIHGLAPGATITAQGSKEGFIVSSELLGRVIDPLGNPLDGKPKVCVGEEVSIFREPTSPLDRSVITEPIDVGIRVVNSMLTVGKGQRVAIMAGSGVGKSTFLGMIARHGRSDINVIALVGERGREVREFIENDLGPEGMERSVLVVSTSDSSALLRLRAAFVATAIAEYFRDQGQSVTLMCDSITRFCMAQREIGLAVGEPPSTAGYTPSVFAILPKLLERAGTTAGKGSITGFYTVLVEGDDMNEPIADAVRGILDGHFVLTRKLASRAHFPALDVLQSISRVMPNVTDEAKVLRALHARRVLADYLEAEDLITIGAYKSGQNPKVDEAVRLIDPLREFLCQRPHEMNTLEESDQLLTQILG
jgi:flagellum-specific ATP synthase